MNSFKKQIVYSVMTFAVISSLLISCREKNSGELADRLVELDAGSGLVENSKVREYEKRIESLEKKAEEIMESVQEQGTLQEVLALKYMDLQMYGPAVESLTRAIAIYPEKATLYYYRGVGCGVLAQSSDLPDVRRLYLDRAETNYRRAITLDARYAPPYYALAILIIYEEERPLDAADLLDTYLEIERSDSRAMMLRAQIFELEGRDSQAREMYKTILNTAVDETYKKAAEMKLGEMP